MANLQSILVVIIKKTTRNCDNNIANLKRLFSDKIFNIQVCEIDRVIDNSESPDIDKCNLENYDMLKALMFAKEGPYIFDAAENKILTGCWWTNLPCIIIKDSSVSLMSCHEIKERILYGLSKAKLLFLTHWTDLCEKYESINEYLKWSVHPTATQAILYTPEMRDLVLEELPKSGKNLSAYLNACLASYKLKGAVYVPNLIDFDINLATDNADFAKANACLQTIDNTQNSTTNTIAWIVVFIILLLLVVVGVALM